MKYKLTEKQKGRIVRWVEALRSGQYAQGRSALKKDYPDNRPQRYCCLGVLCDLHAKENNYKWTNTGGTESYMGETIVPPVEVRKWAGLLNNKTDMVEENLFISNLMQLNDSARWTFDQIATAIEKEMLS